MLVLTVWTTAVVPYVFVNSTDTMTHAKGIKFKLEKVKHDRQGPERICLRKAVQS